MQQHTLITLASWIALFFPPADHWNVDEVMHKTNHQFNLWIYFDRANVVGNGNVYLSIVFGAGKVPHALFWVDAGDGCRHSRVYRLLVRALRGFIPYRRNVCSRSSSGIALLCGRHETFTDGSESI